MPPKSMADSLKLFYFQDIQQIRMSKWSNNRLVCLGDAAYAPTPLGGEGTTLAITGAYILAGELSKLERNDHPSIALESYESSFHPFVEEVQHIPFFIPSIAHPQAACSEEMDSAKSGVVTV